MNVYEKILAQAEDRARLRMTAAKADRLYKRRDGTWKEQKSFTRNMARSGRTEDSVERPTEIDAVESIRRGHLVIVRSYGQEIYYPRKSAAYYIRELENVHNHTKRCRHCGNEKSKVDFSPDKRNRDGLQSYCKHCRMIIASERRRAA